MAAEIVKRLLEAPAILFLEMNKPLSFIASQGMLVAMPMFAPLVGAQRIAELSQIISDRANIDLLITRIEEMSVAQSGADAQGAKS